MATYYGILIHALCEHVPESSESEYAELLGTMRVDGFDPRFPVVMLGDWVLDGRTRMRAAKELGIEPVVIQWAPAFEGDTPAKFVMRALTRRSLKAQDRLRIALRLCPPPELVEEKAARKIKPVLQPPPLDSEEDKSAKLHQPFSEHDGEGAKLHHRKPEHMTQREAAKAANVSKRYIATATRLAKVNPEAYRKFQAQELTLAQAERAAIGPPPPIRPPIPGLDEALSAAGRFDKLATEALRLAGDILALASEPVGRELAGQRIHTLLKGIAAEVRSAKAHGPCRCDGKDNVCGWCHGSGWLTKDQTNRLPPIVGVA